MSPCQESFRGCFTFRTLIHLYSISKLIIYIKIYFFTSFRSTVLTENTAFRQRNRPNFIIFLSGLSSSIIFAHWDIIVHQQLIQFAY